MEYKEKVMNCEKSGKKVVDYFLIHVLHLHSGVLFDQPGLISETFGIHSYLAKNIFNLKNPAL